MKAKVFELSVGKFKRGGKPKVALPELPQILVTYMQRRTDAYKEAAINKCHKSGDTRLWNVRSEVRKKKITHARTTHTSSCIINTHYFM